MMARIDTLQTQLNALATMSPVQLKLFWLNLSGIDLPHASPNLLRHLIAQRLQEKALGKLPIQVERQLERFGGKSGVDVPSTPRQVPILTGTRFIREWNGKTIAVTATEGGFEWNSEIYRSLSEIARKVTGAHWSGPRFFDLTAKAA